MALATFCMSVYNGMPHLVPCMESILNQSIDDFEIIIVNDGSTDETKDYLYSIKDPRLIVIDQVHKGLGYSRNQSIKNVKTEYVVIMDADDISKQDRLKDQIEFISNHKHVVLCGTQFEFIIEDEKNTFSSQLPLTHNTIVRTLLKGGHGICHPTIICRTAAVRRIGGYKLKGYGEDWDFYLRMSEVGQLRNLPHVLLKKRIHDRNVSIFNLTNVRIGIAYAIKAKHCRDLHLRAPSFKTFESEWKNKSKSEEKKEIKFGKSQIYYSKGVVAHLKKQNVSKFLFFILASLYDPQRFFWRIKQMVSYKIQSLYKKKQETY